MNIFYNYNTLSKEEKIKFNIQLIKEYPFLLPRNEEDNSELENYDYSWTLANVIPKGWLIAFGELFFKELKEELIKYNCLNDYRVVEIKEKFGQLRWYSSGYPFNFRISDIEEKYAILSGNICIGCGKPDVPMVSDVWISPYCENCWVEHCINDFSNRADSVEEAKGLYEKLTKGNRTEMSNLYAYTRFSKDKGKEEFKIDISNIANNIRKNWKKLKC